MVSALANVFAQWQAAQNPEITVARLPWPQLEAITAITVGLRPYVDASSFAAETARAVFGVRRILTSTPLPPHHPAVGVAELRHRTQSFLAERPAHTLCEQLRPLDDALGDLLDTISPLGSWFADVLSEYGDTEHGTPEALIVVPRRAWLSAVLEWLRAEELTCADIATPSDVRDGGRPHLVTVLAGHPAMAYSSPWKAPETALREHGWLLTSPPSPTVRLALTTDAPALTETALWLLPATAHPVLTIHDPGPTRSTAVVHGWMATTPQGTSHIRLPQLNTSGDSETAATEVHLASNHSVFFHPEVGPRPHIVAVDEETRAVAMSTIAPSALQPGMLLAVRVGAASHDDVVILADAWLREHRGWSSEQIAQARAAATMLKTRLARALEIQGPTQLQQRLVDAGLGNGYAQVLIHNPLDEHYIAPQRRAGFDALVDAIGAQELHQLFATLAAVRTAHQQAGEQIRRDIVRLLRDQPWTSRIDEDGSVALHAGQLGTLLLTVVTARLDDPVRIPRTWLGVPIDKHGQRVHTLPTDEFASEAALVEDEELL